MTLLWPPAGLSRQVTVRPHNWHVVEMGQGPDLLLLHGTAASTHSWREIMPILAEQFHVIAVDLPGHGQTRLGAKQRSSLEHVAPDLAALSAHEGWRPAAIIGHSAGAAVALRLAHSQDNVPVIGINPALQPFLGLAGLAFPMVARMMAMTPGVTRMAVRSMADVSRVEGLLRNTGSHLSQDQIALYAQLFRNPAHVDGVLRMMAQWKLDGLLADLPRLTMPCLFLTGSRDRTVPPVVAVEAAARMPRAAAQSLDGFGHLVHEEAPALVASIVTDWLQRVPALA